MLEKHRCKDGNVVLIAQMSDEHLCNTIHYYLRKVFEAQQLLKRIDQSTTFQRHLYGLSEISQKDLAEVIRKVVQMLYPYLAEAYLRDLAGPRQAMIDILGRDKAIEADVLLLEADNEDYDE